MDIRFNEQEQAFRKEIRTFLDKELPKDYQINLDSLKKNRDVARSRLNQDYEQRRAIEAAFNADLVRLRELTATEEP